MPKKGSSRSKRRARRLAVQQNLRYTEALQRSTGECDPKEGEDGRAPIKIDVTALDALHSTMDRMQATDPADAAVALLTTFRVLALTSTANRLIHEALLEADFEVYWPGEGFLCDARRQYLGLAVEWLESVLPAAARACHHHDQVRMLTPPDTAPQAYEPMHCDGLVCPPDSTEKARQLLLFRTNSVALANKSVWEQVLVVLGRVLGRLRDPHHRKACRIAALLVGEILQPGSGSGGARRDVDQRILAITVGRRSAAELVADERLMQLLHESVAAAAHANGWSPISAVSSALEHADPSWMPQRWGYPSDIKLIAATKQFSIRRLPRKGQQVIEIRGRRRAR
ncbi:hypothetical protein ACFXNW_18255 [Nocardia sp. NPDC059180]|uniref:hypothetical protein n=1 Tax=Nocardia sp. NPDC059180 TaxID=3346761 RepID=UPI0036951295